MAEATASGRNFRWARAKHHGGQDKNERRKRFFDRHEWWFVVLGLVGNALFFLGSVAFLFKSLETFAISMFIAGSCFMLVSSAAQSISEFSSNQLE